MLEQLVSLTASQPYTNSKDLFDEPNFGNTQTISYLDMQTPQMRTFLYHIPRGLAFKNITSVQTPQKSPTGVLPHA